MEPPSVPECLACGACCFGDGERYVPVSGDDHFRLGERADELTRFVGNRCYMRMHEGHCAALELRPDGQFFCSVYAQRPGVCRELMRGSPACEAEFLQKGERSRRALLPVLQPTYASAGVKAVRSRRLRRCTACGLNPRLCICAALPALSVRTRVVVIAHRAERHKSTNTGRLAARMLQGATFSYRSGEAVEVDRPDGESWVLFPSEHALPLREAAARGLRTLIVPDGTWNQAKRIARRDPACLGARHVRLEAGRSSGYGLRRNARPDGLCTLEAIAEALRALEGDAPADAMLELFERWVARAKRVRAGAHDSTA